jgi:hypothetical protein
MKNSSMVIELKHTAEINTQQNSYKNGKQLSYRNTPP